jgi:prenyltransferase beta subunit
MAWRSSRNPRALVRLLTAVLAACALLTSWASDAALAAPSNATNEKRLDSTVRFLQEAQNMDGGFGGNAGEPSDQDFSGWVALALAADGINPQDQAKPGGTDVYSYLSDHVAQALHKELCEPVVCTTAFERELLVVDASGTSPRDFGGIDLVGELLVRKLPDGSFPYVPKGAGEVNDTVFAILGLSLVEEPAAQAALGPAAKWLITQQNDDGGWAWHDKGSPSEADLTGAAMEALIAAKIHNTETADALSAALKFLHKAQDPDGGFRELLSEQESNVASTAWATQGLWAVGENPETWTEASGREPLDYLESMQQPDGHIRYRESEESDGIWMTAYAAPAFAGQPLPIATVPRAVPPPIAPSRGTGVIAGGGGSGAPLFSRPQPQSQGETPGGVRLLSDKRRRDRSKRKHTAHKAAIKRRRNPAAPRRSPAPTTTTSTPGTTAQHDHPGAGTASGAAGGRHANGEVVKGIAIGATGPVTTSGTLEPGAPGLRSAGSSDGQTPWLAIAIAAALLLAALLGAQLERRRAQVIL